MNGWSQRTLVERLFQEPELRKKLLKHYAVEPIQFDVKGLKVKDIKRPIPTGVS